jgi:hypothetical protein
VPFRCQFFRCFRVILEVQAGRANHQFRAFHRSVNRRLGLPNERRESRKRSFSTLDLSDIVLLDIIRFTDITPQSDQAWACFSPFIAGHVQPLLNVRNAKADNDGT